MSNSTQSEIGSLVISISSRALFNLDQSHRVFQEQGLDAYQEYQIAREDEPLEQGVAFVLVQKLLHLNNLLDESPVEVILLSRNSADTGLRIFNSIQHYDLDITRAAFSGGDSPYRYISAFNSHLFLSTDGVDVSQALELGVAAATILPSKKPNAHHESLKIAFDGDAIIVGGAGLTRRDDGGVLTPLPGPKGGNILSLATHNNRAGRIAAGLSNGGVALSEDGGQSWETLTLPAEPNSVIYWLGTHPDRADVVVAAHLTHHPRKPPQSGNCHPKVRHPSRSQSLFFTR